MEATDLGVSDERDPQTAESGYVPIKRISKACERCRTRRTRCLGGVPCDLCKKVGLGNECLVRNKARPKRRPSKLASTQSTSSDSLVTGSPVATTGPVATPAQPVLSPFLHLYPFPTLETDLQSTPNLNHQASSSTHHYTVTNPITLIEDSAATWCSQHDLPFESIYYRDSPRLPTLPDTALPPDPLIVLFEDGLMSHIVDSVDLASRNRELNTIDRPRLLGLYGRYRTLPKSLTDDQTALVYATLSLSRFTQISSVGTNGEEEHRREDITYYRMACGMLSKWNRPSIYALWALFCLMPVVNDAGAICEFSDILKQTAWQVRELGIHKLSTAQLYDPGDMVQIMFSSYLYTDTFRASLTDLTPSIPLSDIELDATPPPTFAPPALRNAFVHTAYFLRDLVDANIDTTSEEYINRTEAEWESALKVIRKESPSGRFRARLGWAMIRYHWMRVLLHFPLFASGLPSHIHTLTRSVSHIIHIHTDLASIGWLVPSWPQLKRLSACGQVLILLCAGKEVEVVEGGHLFGMLLDLLKAHIPLWPIASTLHSGFQAAVTKLDLKIPLRHEEIGWTSFPTSSFNRFHNYGELHSNQSLLFDPTTFFNLTQGQDGEDFQI